MPLSGRKVKSPEEEEEREKRRREKITPLIMATYVCHAVRTAHALRSTNNTINNGHYVRSAGARTLLGPMVNYTRDSKTAIFLCV